MVTRIQKIYGATMPERRGRTFDSYKLKRKGDGAFDRVLLEVWREQEELKVRIVDVR